MRNGSASASAMFADSFEAYTDATPLPWTKGTTASFSCDISGEYDIDPGIVDPSSPVTSNFTSPQKQLLDCVIVATPDWCLAL